MLDVLTAAHLGNTVAVVTRYFGGTLLGTGGLVRAYSSAVQGAIDEAPLVDVQRVPKAAVRVPLAVAGKVEAELRGSGWQVLATEWAGELTVQVAAREGDWPKLRSQLAQLLQGEPMLEPAGHVELEVPAQK